MTSTPAWISLGSNLGDRRAILDAAVAALGRTPGIAVSAVSSYRETRPVGGPPGQGPFLNAAARLDTTLSPRELLRALQAIELDLGRVRTVRWGERTLDLDILMWGDEIIEERDLIIPHPRFSTRRFVIRPLDEIGPAVLDPRTGLKVTELLGNLDHPSRRAIIDGSVADRVPGIEERVERLLVSESLAHWQIRVMNWDLLNRICRKWDDAPDRLWFLDVRRPTFAVTAPARWQGRGLSHFPVPVYRLAATDPDAIVAEVVAVCKGIESD